MRFLRNLFSYNFCKAIPSVTKLIIKVSRNNLMNYYSLQYYVVQKSRLEKIFWWFSVKFNPNGDTASAAHMVISCVFFMSIVFIVSLIIKIMLRTCQERLTFVNRVDNVKYHLTSLCMEIVEITEQYCYSMNIAISIVNNLIKHP